MFHIVGIAVDVVGRDACVLHEVHFPQAVRPGYGGGAAKTQRSELDGFFRPLHDTAVLRPSQKPIQDTRSPIAVATKSVDADGFVRRRLRFIKFVK